MRARPLAGHTCIPPMESTRYCPWATAREARDQLGVSERTLARWRASGLFQPGQHWRRKFPSPNSPVQYHLEQCQAVMSEATARSAHLLEPSHVSTRTPQKKHRTQPVRQRKP